MNALPAHIVSLVTDKSILEHRTLRIRFVNSFPVPQTKRAGVETKLRGVAEIKNTALAGIWPVVLPDPFLQLILVMYVKEIFMTSWQSKILCAPGFIIFPVE
jgi:hypothetical protein